MQMSSKLDHYNLGYWLLLLHDLDSHEYSLFDITTIEILLTPGKTKVLLHLSTPTCDGTLAIILYLPCMLSQVIGSDESPIAYGTLERSFASMHSLMPGKLVRSGES